MSYEQPPRDYQAELQVILNLATKVTAIIPGAMLQDFSKGVAHLPGITVVANTQEDEPNADA